MHRRASLGLHETRRWLSALGNGYPPRGRTAHSLEANACGGRDNLALEIAVSKGQFQGMHMDTFVRISRLIDQARSVPRSWQL